MGLMEVSRTKCFFKIFTLNLIDLENIFVKKLIWTQFCENYLYLNKPFDARMVEFTILVIELAVNPFTNKGKINKDTYTWVYRSMEWRLNLW